MLYLHLPFCHHRCIYCNFFASAAKSGRDGFEDLILKELTLRREFLGGATLPSIYLGGGTPSLLRPAQLEIILDGIREQFTIADDVEITLEANPEDLNLENCMAWLNMGINRLSIGVQSFHDDDLLWLGRIHDAAKSHNGIETALKAGFHEISIDLIYGIPGQTVGRWHENLGAFQSYQLPHLSAYWLTVEPSTPLEKLLAKGRKAKLDEVEGEEHFNVLMEWAQYTSYEHYEISNLCLPGHYSKHNKAYWDGHPYLGLGPSAHSYKPGYRCWNPSSLAGYEEGLEKGRSIEGEEILSKSDQYNEFVMLRLRTMWGCNLEELESIFGSKACDHARASAEVFIEQGLMMLNEKILYLTEKGRLYADGIASEFFVEE